MFYRDVVQGKFISYFHICIPPSFNVHSTIKTVDDTEDNSNMDEKIIRNGKLHERMQKVTTETANIEGRSKEALGCV